MTPQTCGGDALKGKEDDPAARHCNAPQHGDRNAYKVGCRCPNARMDASRAQKSYRLRLIRVGQLSTSSTGTHRRIQALGAIGWRAEDIGRRIGTTSRGVSLLLTRDRVYVSTATRVAAVYDQLAAHPGPSARTARRAAAKGWLPPAWWDDDTIDDPTYQPATVDRAHWTDIDPVAVERACNGEDIPLTRAERIAAVQRLTDRGFSQLQTADRLGIHPRQVTRDLRAEEKVA
jgi:hypothetical protein